MRTSDPAALNAVTGLARERVRALDLAAGLAVFFMILVHVLWHWGRPETWTTPIGEAISYAAGPTAAPVFTFLMGVSLGAAPRSSVGTLVARGLWLVLLGYVLNLLRGVIPAALGFATGVITPEQVAPYTLWWLATTVDLHHVIGLSMVVIALLRTRTGPGWLSLGLGGALVLAAPWLRSLTFGAPILDAPLTPVLGSAANVYYAVVPWLVYPLAGALFGAILASARDRVAVFRRGAALGVVLLVVGGGLILLQRPGFDVFTYWRQPASFVVAIFGVILVWLALCDVVTRQQWIDRHLGVVYGWSDRVIAMYFTHWIIVGWGIGLVGFRALGLGPVLVAMAAAVVATSYGSRFAVRLEASPWFRRAASGHGSEVGVEVPVASD
ncbi:MAG TPA: heparan-alpha-glucosaminide N-acetyltransferase domain-containing protein [Methylomirabilota bacterium]|nr:heparan-alpha-glucosaminide N-acetyltransferase domain-containing protein [Methylomirabilota bacterium]